MVRQALRTRERGGGGGELGTAPLVPCGRPGSTEHAGRAERRRDVRPKSPAVAGGAGASRGPPTRAGTPPPPPRVAAAVRAARRAMGWRGGRVAGRRSVPTRHSCTDSPQTAAPPRQRRRRSTHRPLPPACLRPSRKGDSPPVAVPAAAADARQGKERGKAVVGLGVHGTFSSRESGRREGPPHGFGAPCRSLWADGPRGGAARAGVAAPAAPPPTNRVPTMGLRPRPSSALGFAAGGGWPPTGVPTARCWLATEAWHFSRGGVCIQPSRRRVAAARPRCRPPLVTVKGVVGEWRGPPAAPPREFEVERVPPPTVGPLLGGAARGARGSWLGATASIHGEGWDSDPRQFSPPRRRKKRTLEDAKDRPVGGTSLAAHRGVSGPQRLSPRVVVVGERPRLYRTSLTPIKCHSGCGPGKSPGEVTEPHRGAWHQGSCPGRPPLDGSTDAAKHCTRPARLFNRCPCCEGGMGGLVW